jgi:glycosyltransferase involved in cell wall biosynthesis
MKRASFTVLMCTYSKDDPYLLEKSIESVFKNSIKPNHFILTIDGPIPKLNEKIINKISKKYPIELNVLDKNLGLALALNNAINLVKTEWIARADSDDINLYDRFNKQLALTNKNFDVIGSNILEIDKHGKLPKLTKNIPITNKEIRKYLKLRNPINHMTVFFKTKLIKSVGGYPNIYLREDYGLWIKLSKKGAIFHNIDEVLVHVNGGKNLYKRRRGFKNAIAESKLQFLLYQCKIKPLFLALFHLILRTTFLLLPSKIVERIYIEKLRNKN